MTISEAVKKYRLPNPATQEDLETRMLTKVLRFDDRILVAGNYYIGNGKFGYFGAVYEFLNDEEEHDCESQIGLAAVSDPMFYDDGHAIFWGMMKELIDRTSR